jgi:hypothetical protein
MSKADGRKQTPGSTEGKEEQNVQEYGGHDEQSSA